jgi:hypothetical protein
MGRRNRTIVAFCKNYAALDAFARAKTKQHWAPTFLVG